MTTPEFGGIRYFRETEPVELWSATMPLPPTPFEVFQSRVLRLAGLNRERYTGFVHLDMDGFVTDFTRTRYPRRKYGVPTVNACVMGMWALADEFDSTVAREEQHGGLRVVMGLKEGYAADAPVHSVADVMYRMPEAQVEAASVFAVRLTDGGASAYSEPVAVVRTGVNARFDLYRLGDDLKQERFSIEDFDAHQAYMVETRYCTEPD